MDTNEAARTIAEPLGKVGMQFYFTKHSAIAAQEVGIDAILLYAGGRGGVIADADAARVDEVFYFFAPGFMGSVAESAWSTAGREVTVAKHLEASNAYATDTFGEVDPEVLTAFDEAATALIASLPTGRWPIVDGYRAFELPADLVQRTYRHTVVLRELRGGVHTECAAEAGLDPQVACRIDQDGAFYEIHGYGKPTEITPSEEEIALKRSVEAATSAAMVELLEALDEAQLEALVAGSLAFRAAL